MQKFSKDRKVMDSFPEDFYGEGLLRQISMREHILKMENCHRLRMFSHMVYLDIRIAMLNFIRLMKVLIFIIIIKKILPSLGEMGFKVYRTSIAWTRLFPTGEGRPAK